MASGTAISSQVQGAWLQRGLLWPLSRRTLQKSTAGTVLGPLWLVIRPVLSVGLMAFVFGGVVGFSGGGVPYPLFLLAGVIGWELFSQTLLWSTRSIDLQRRVMRRVELPALLVPLSATVRAGVDVLVCAVLLVLTCVAYTVADGQGYIILEPALLLVPLGLVLAYALALGLGLATAVLNARWRDVRLGLRYPVAGLLYISPVLYPASQLPGVMGDYAWVNPLTAPLEMVRFGLFGLTEPSAWAMVYSTGVAAMVVAGGLSYFSATMRARPLLAAERFGGGDDDDE